MDFDTPRVPFIWSFEPKGGRSISPKDECNNEQLSEYYYF